MNSEQFAVNENHLGTPGLDAQVVLSYPCSPVFIRGQYGFCRQRDLILIPRRQELGASSRRFPRLP